MLKITRPAGWLAAFSAGVILLAGCGSSNNQSEKAAANPGGATQESVKGGLDRPMKVGLLFEVPGESQVAVPDFANMGKLAVENINERGGVGGYPIEMKRMPVTTLDPQEAASDFLKMVDWGPDVIIGFPGTQLVTLMPQIDRAGIPVLTPATDRNTLKGSDSGSQWLWTLPPTLPSVPSIAAQFVLEDTQAEEIAQIYTNEPFGLVSSSAFESRLEADGVALVSNQKVSPTASNLTSQVLEFDDADFLAAWVFPNQYGILVKQLAQNGLSIPIIGSGSAELAVGFGTVDPEETLGEFYAVIGCDPHSPKSGSDLEAVMKAYSAAYPDAPTPFSQAVSVYDGVQIAAKAVEKAGSLAPGDINAFIPEVQHSGICGQYEADGAHRLSHTARVVQFTREGSKTVKTVSIDSVSSADELE